MTVAGCRVARFPWREGSISCWCACAARESGCVGGLSGKGRVSAAHMAGWKAINESSTNAGPPVCRSGRPAAAAGGVENRTRPEESVRDLADVGRRRAGLCVRRSRSSHLAAGSANWRPSEAPPPSSLQLVILRRSRMHAGARVASSAVEQPVSKETFPTVPGNCADAQTEQCDVSRTRVMNDPCEGCSPARSATCAPRAAPRRAAPL